METINKPTFNLKPVLSGLLFVFGALLIVTLTNNFLPNCVGHITSIVVMTGIYAFYKFCFRNTFKSYITLNDSQTIKLIFTFLAADVLLALFCGLQCGFVLPAITSFTIALAAGITEELLFRGIFASLMMRKSKNSYLYALIVPAVVFGVGHLTNALVTHDLSAVLYQSVLGISMGFFFGALYLRTGNVIPGIALHAIHDLLVDCVASTNALPIFIDILLCGVCILGPLVIAYFLLKGQKENILNLWKNKWSR